jgi:transcriptional regulator with XRE-family HTH domain
VFKEKDPIIDAMRTAFEDAGGSYTKIKERSGVSSSTIYNWFNGKTRRPQFATVAEFAIACGKHGIVFGANGPRLVGRTVPKEQRAWTGNKRRKVG